MSHSAPVVAVEEQDVRGWAALRVSAFFGLAFAMSWAWWIPLALDGQTVRRGAGGPTHIPGLLGPLLAALLVLAATEGPQGVRRWAAGFVRWPREARWRLAAVAPVGFLALGIAIVAVLGELPPASEFVRFSGTAPTVAALLVAIAVGAFGEEAGWRGYALPRLQARLGSVRATLVLALLWAAWHTAYNLSAATAAADGAIAAISTACVIFWAVSLIQAERAGQPALGGARRV
jgi:membrane protease YdiL (CAAX protease family)